MTLTPNDIHARLGASGWQSVLSQVVDASYLQNKHGPCPACGGRDRFRYDNRRGRGDFICNACGAGDGFALLMRITGMSFTDAIKRVMELAGLESNEGTSVAILARNVLTLIGVRCARLLDCLAERPAEPLEWSTLAESIWSRTQALRGTLGEVYLRHRGCVLPPMDSDLRYLPPDGKYPPSLCARITDAVIDAPMSLHFTRLATDGKGKAGTDRDKLLLKGHRKAGGVVRLWPDDCVTYSLGIAEGIETALSLAHGHNPVWAAIDAGNLADLPVLDGIETLIVAADHDDAGLRAASAVGQRWAGAGKIVKIIAPDVAGQDVNDAVAA